MSSCCSSQTQGFNANFSGLLGDEDCSFEPTLWVKCSECGLPQGYPEGACRKICVAGKAYVATSRISENITNPHDYLTDKTGNAPWRVESFCELVERLANSPEPAKPPMGLLDETKSIYFREEKSLSGVYDVDNEVCHTLTELGAPSDAVSVTLYVRTLAAQHVPVITKENIRTRAYVEFEDGRKIASNVGSDAQTTADNPDHQNNSEITVRVKDGKVCYKVTHITLTQLPGDGTVHDPQTTNAAVQSLIDVRAIKWSR